MGHPLHLAVAEEIQNRLNGLAELVRDPACGGSQQLPLFVGQLFLGVKCHGGVL
jgi:hypothetical protein